EAEQPALRRRRMRGDVQVELRDRTEQAFERERDHLVGDAKHDPAGAGDAREHWRGEKLLAHRFRRVGILRGGRASPEPHGRGWILDRKAGGRLEQRLLADMLRAEVDAEEAWTPAPAPPDGREPVVAATDDEVV